MKSVTIAAALLASVAVAQPHGHHLRHEHAQEKRDVVIEYETVYETVTLLVDDYTTETILPSKTPEVKHTSTSANIGGQFYEGASSSSPTPVVQSTTPEVKAPQPTTTPAQPTTTPQAAPTVEYSPPAQSTAASSSGSSGGSGTYDRNGKMTYYQVGLGSCGYNDAGADQTKNIVAVSVAYFKSISPLTNYGIDQPANPLCDKTITISANGKTVEAVIRDSCPECEMDGIDVTEKVFKELMGGLDAGKVDVSWKLN